MKNILLFLALLTFNTYAESLKETLVEVLQTNPIIIERHQNYLATREGITIARAGYYPTLDISLEAGKEKTDRTPTGGTTATTDYDVHQAAATLKYNLFNGLETNYRIEEEQARTSVAAYNYIETVNGTTMDLVSAYVEVLRTDALLATAHQNVEINDEIFNKVSKLYKSGLTTLSEVNKIESSLSLARSNAVVNENNLASTRSALERIAGHDIKPSAMTAPGFPYALPATVAEAEAYALKNNPSVLISDYAVEQAYASKKTAQSAYYPSLDLEVSQSKSKHINAYDGEEDQFKAMATLNFNLFNGFTDSSTIEQNAILVQQKRASRDQLKREVRESLQLAWNSYTKLSRQLKHLQDYKTFSQKTLGLYSKEYDLGRRSLLDLLAAQSDFIGAKSQIVNTEYDILLAKFRLLETMGIISTSILDDGNAVYDNVCAATPAQRE